MLAGGGSRRRHFGLEARSARVEPRGRSKQPSRRGSAPLTACLRLLKRLQKTGLVGRAGNEQSVVRQRLVVASHQFRKAGTARSSQVGARSGAAEGVQPAQAGVIRRSMHILVYREEAHSQELREARQRATGAVPAGNPARVLSRVPAGRPAADAAQERGPAGRLHFDFPDCPAQSGFARLEFVGYCAAARRRSTSRNASSAA